MLKTHQRKVRLGSIDMDSREYPKGETYIKETTYTADLDILLEAAGIDRAFVVQDLEEVDRLRVAIFQGDALIVSEISIPLGEVLSKARRYPGQSFADCVCDCIADEEEQIRPELSLHQWDQAERMYVDNWRSIGGELVGPDGEFMIEDTGRPDWIVKALAYIAARSN